MDDVEIVARAIEESIRNARMTPAGSSWYYPEDRAVLAALRASGWVKVSPDQVVVPRPQQYTYGHCAEKKKPGGCQLHNLQCGYPDCDRAMIGARPKE